LTSRTSKSTSFHAEVEQPMRDQIMSSGWSLFFSI
jgi:hypothetical protein